MNLEEYKTTVKPRGCPRCGEKNVGAVSVTLSKLGPKGQNTGGGRITSKTKSLCEACAIQVYELVLATLDENTS